MNYNWIKYGTVCIYLVVVLGALGWGALQDAFILDVYSLVILLLTLCSRAESIRVNKWIFWMIVLQAFVCGIMIVSLLLFEAKLSGSLKTFSESPGLVIVGLALLLSVLMWLAWGWRNVGAIRVDILKARAPS